LCACSQATTSPATQVPGPGPTESTPQETQAAPDEESGIEGQVLIGPACPGPESPVQDDCADKPYQAVIQILDQNNQRLAEFQTDVQGRFKVPIEPGRYILHPVTSGRFPTAADQEIEVKSGEYTRVTITFDSGIR